MLTQKEKYEFIKHKIYQSIITGLFITATFLVSQSVVKNIGREVFRGFIKDYKVVYSEERFSKESPESLRMNEMKVSDGTNTYRLLDITDRKSVYSPDFEEAELEKIIIGNRDGKKTFYRSHITPDSSSEYSLETKAVFEKGDKLYIDLGKEVKNIEDLKYKTMLDEVGMNLKKR